MGLLLKSKKEMLAHESPAMSASKENTTDYPVYQVGI